MDFTRMTTRGYALIGVYVAAIVWTFAGLFYRNTFKPLNVYINLGWKLGYLVFLAVAGVIYAVERRRRLEREARLKRGLPRRW
jgi:hypothetical protein